MVHRLMKLPYGVNHRLNFMSPKLSIGHKRSAEQIINYAPTIKNPDYIKRKFNEELDSFIAAVTKSEDLITPRNTSRERIHVQTLGWDCWKA